ncbi:uncharacterized protein PV07_11313 [Cladophialophora immunda]|uniref:Uncharacterized protein n=1 Tax=Cladophialophora immunda TaxID=569365 RepID=A0A0D2ADW3_9EURO|nr:uncharacterized protein PV07_11313 [Cladophialophora immunda]KIW23087.1 hypothetical protein PV07_11313 [Cladophialophora immunda]OQU93587.1 hypothetical protein CLAIMM_00074 [Cladophialophora immunda]
MDSPHRDCHCPHCSTGSSKRTQSQQPVPHPGEQTVKVLKFSARDVFPVIRVLDAPVRLASRMAKSMNPFPIRLERNVAAPPYERGWTYVERRNGQLCVVRNRKDVFRLHRPSKKKRAPPPPRDTGREPERHVIIVHDEDLDVINRHHRVRPEGDRLFVEVIQERDGRGDPGDHGNSAARPRPRIEVRRPLNATPPSSPIFEAHHGESFPFRIVHKIPVDRARLRRVRPVQVIHDPLQCPPPNDANDDDCYEELFDPVDLPAREPRPYHIPEPENSVWDEGMNAWVVRRSPKVRFS